MNSIIPEKMKAVYLTGSKRVEILEVDTPKITNENEVLVRVKAVGVCGSDLTAWKGEHKHVTFPVIPGHEIAGEVVAVGTGVTHLKLGDRVVREPIDYCGKCYACTHGHPNVCRELKVWGFGEDGGHREFFVSPEDKLFKFPKTIDWKVAALIEPYTIAAQVNERGRIQAGDVVLIHGLGPAGMCIGDWAKSHGATVIASDMVTARLEMAKDFGFDFVLNVTEVNINEEVMRITKGEGANVIVEASGVPVLMEQALDILSPAGRIVPISFNFNPTPIILGNLNVKEAAIIGSRLQSGKFPVVIDELEVHKPHIEKQITNVFHFTEIEKAFELAVSRDPNVCKVVVIYE